MTATEKPNLSLYGIEAELFGLFTAREAALEDPEMTPKEIDETVALLEHEIREYVRLELKKVDGVAHYLREYEARAQVLKEEAKRCTDRARAEQSKHDFLEQLVIDVMKMTQQTRIDGRHSVLQLKKNPPSVDPNIQINLVPEELLRRTVTMTEQVYQTLLNGPMGTLLLTGTAKDPEPMKAEIAKRLKEGDGIPGCRLRTDGVRLEVK